MATSSLVRPPSASPIVRSLSKPPVSAHNSRNARVRSRRPETPICRRFCILGAADLLLAMQKVEGSNPFSRLKKYTPLRTLVWEDDDGRAWFTVDQPSTQFASFGVPDVSAIGVELDRKLACLLKALGAEVPLAWGINIVFTDGAYYYLVGRERGGKAGIAKLQTAAQHLYNRVHE
jgi:hypothetical protein